MRSADIQEVALYSYISPEQRVPADHPLRPIRAMVNAVLRTLSPEFNKIYSIYGRPSIPPERLLRCLLLQVLYRAQRAHDDGAAGLQRALSLVRRTEYGRPDLGRDRVYQESHAVPGRGDCRQI